MVDITSLTAFRLERLDRDRSIVDGKGYPEQDFQRKWQKQGGSLEGAIQILATALVDILAGQEATESVSLASSLATSGAVGLTITATDAGANATISISAHTRIYGDGTSVSVGAGTITGKAYSTTYYIYYDDAARTGGAVTYQATTTQATAAQTGDRHSLGAVTTPAAGGSSSSGNPNLPPGVVEP